jgi:hypothetical protein
MRRFLTIALAISAISLVVVGASGALASGPVPNVTGTWTPTTGGSWHLTASGPGLNHLHATWAGAPGSGHEALRGVFDGTLSGSTYTGPFQINEGATNVTGTMAFQIVNSTTIVVTLRVTGSTATQTITMHGHAAGGATPVKINISFVAGNAVTAPPKARGQGVPSSQECPAARVRAKADGHIEAQITPAGDVQGTGYVHEDPYDRRCHNPRILFKVDRISIAVTQPGHVVHATLYVHIDGEALHQPGQCRVGTPGTIQATYDDTKRGGNGLGEDDALRIGPWGGAGCNAHVHLITDDQSKDQSTWVRAEIACLDPSGRSGYSPRNCGA